MSQTALGHRHQRTLETITRLYEDGETDAYGGGVAAATITEAMEFHEGTTRRYVSALADVGDLEQVRGMGPRGVRPSYVPTEADR
ncbi:hypothetical protein [Natronosalvus rutilus]|uniref:Uncharacterized protein n=1 Tax=Natronosalvus rutilus TaxID=2953753 RepID=A0A9E7SUE7_9EURY|nr:hypothetical protein [Natronosalvus rutilus]UTF52782.1 hypothetical protein NGM29_13445 [Natronosalvus rutilus]